MQILAPESIQLRLGLVEYLAGVLHVQATEALARLAIFSIEEEVRLSAIDALRARPDQDYSEILLQGLRYPLPAVARNASNALLRLGRVDLVPQLVELLDAPDPRAPIVKHTNDKSVPMVRELVRVNHHRNCLLCHEPGSSLDIGAHRLTAPVPVPSDPLSGPGDPMSGSSFSGGYNAFSSSPELAVRIDVTYLRQDFSVRQPVTHARPWPKMQRFDFLVRTRELTEAEASAYREKFAKQEPGRPNPYQLVALGALRELTGLDAEPTSAGWRRLLNLRAKPKTALN
jgi:hypothetical protein